MKVFRFKQQPKLEKKKADNSRIYNNPEARDHPRATLMASTETKTYIFTLLLISNKKKLNSGPNNEKLRLVPLQKLLERIFDI